MLAQIAAALFRRPTAQPAPPPSAPDGRPQPDLRARAHRECRGNPYLKRLYLEKHAVLMNGRGGLNL
jgi:hypothetical protein